MCVFPCIYCLDFLLNQDKIERLIYALKCIMHLFSRMYSALKNNTISM